MDRDHRGGDFFDKVYEKSASTYSYPIVSTESGTIEDAWQQGIKPTITHVLRQLDPGHRVMCVLQVTSALSVRQGFLSLHCTATYRLEMMDQTVGVYGMRDDPPKVFFSRVGCWKS
jgi:hypothetical protein